MKAHEEILGYSSSIAGTYEPDIDPKLYRLNLPIFIN